MESERSVRRLQGPSTHIYSHLRRISKAPEGQRVSEKRLKGYSLQTG